MEINIRTMTEKDLPDCLAIWLAANLSAHDFIAKSYWHDHLAQVAEALPQSQVFCAFWKGKLCGFAGMTNDNYLAGIFIAETMQCQGIGSKLIDFLKERFLTVNLAVYQKNRRAQKFYYRHGFVKKGENIDEMTGELEFQLCWRRNQPVFD